MIGSLLPYTFDLSVPALRDPAADQGVPTHPVGKEVPSFPATVAPLVSDRGTECYDIWLDLVANPVKWISQFVISTSSLHGLIET